MPRGALQIVGDTVVILELEAVLDHGGNDRSNATKLGVPECVAQSLVRQELAFHVLDPFGYDHRAVSIAFHQGIDAGKELCPVETDLGKQNHDRQVTRFFGGETARRGDPAGMPAHDLEDEDLGRGLRHRCHVEARFAQGNGDIFGHRAEAGAAVGDRQIVVHGLRHMDRLDRVAHGLRELGDLQTGIRGIAAAIVEKIADVVRLEDRYQAFVLRTAFVDALELVAAGSECPGGRVPQCRYGGRRFLAGIDQVFGQRPDDTVATRIDFADVVFALACSFDHAAGGSIDHGGDTAGLGIKRISLWHEFSSSIRHGGHGGHGERSKRTTGKLRAHRKW